MNALEGWDRDQARQEGWVLVSLFEEDTPSIMGATGGVFHSNYVGEGWPTVDMKAVEFVKDRAAEGSAYHIDALARTQLL